MSFIFSYISGENSFRAVRTVLVFSRVYLRSAVMDTFSPTEPTFSATSSTDK